jgi:hypothetical protein
MVYEKPRPMGIKGRGHPISGVSGMSGETPPET